ncbi:MAG: M48 family metallopeptidase [Methanimicrococcus sp.]|nr:M48 family metallopeptidase [Methanimicrococcus sp.]
MTKFKAGPNELDCVIIFSKKRKKTLSYTVRYENSIEDDSFNKIDEYDDDTEDDIEDNVEDDIEDNVEDDIEDNVEDDVEDDDSVFQNPKKMPVLFVRAPSSLPVKNVQSVLLENTENIIELLDKATKKEAAALEKSKKAYKNGSVFYYMGRTYTMRLQYEETEKAIRIHLLDGQLFVYLPIKMTEKPEAERERKIKKAVEEFYIEQADVFFNSRTDYFADKYIHLFKRKPKSVKAVYYKGKWGCCTYRDDIKLNWVLIQAETPIIDYVIIHELAHIRHKDHSKDFWALVEAVDPKYKEKRLELKENGWILGMK